MANSNEVKYTPLRVPSNSPFTFNPWKIACIFCIFLFIGSALLNILLYALNKQLKDQLDKQQRQLVVKIDSLPTPSPVPTEKVQNVSRQKYTDVNCHYTFLYSNDLKLSYTANEDTTEKCKWLHLFTENKDVDINISLEDNGQELTDFISDLSTKEASKSFAIDSVQKAQAKNIDGYVINDTASDQHFYLFKLANRLILKIDVKNSDQKVVDYIISNLEELK